MIKEKYDKISPAKIYHFQQQIDRENCNDNFTDSRDAREKRRKKRFVFALRIYAK